MRTSEWCVEDEHAVYEQHGTFNSWLDSDDEEAALVLKSLGMGRLATPSKALFAGDGVAYGEELERFHARLLELALGQGILDDHWVGKNRAHFNALLEPLKAHTVIPFVGAGVSCSSSFPTWTGHILHQARSAGFDVEGIRNRLASGDHEVIIDELVSSRGEGLFIQEMRDAFDREPGDLRLPMLVAGLAGSIIVTTNYDRVLEAALQGLGEASAEIISASEDNARMIRAQSNSRRAIVKIHGDICSPSSFILSGHQYNMSYGAGVPDMRLSLPRKLRHIFEHGSLLFVGCSLTADRTLRVFEGLVEEAGLPNVPRHYAILEAPEVEPDLIAKNARLAALSIDAIWYPHGAHDFVGLILAELNERVSLWGGDSRKGSLARDISTR